MKSQLTLLIATMFLMSTAMADRCYDPYYGYYDCNPSYNYSDQDAALIMEGAFLGYVVGSIMNNNDDDDHHWNHNNYNRRNYNNWNQNGNWNRDHNGYYGRYHH